MLSLDYLNLITSEHRDKPKYIQMLSDVFQPYIDCADAMNNINSMLDMVSAEGVELDLFGEYLGQSRKVNIEFSAGAPYLNDEDYKLLLKAKIIRNYWDGTIEGIYDFWDELFPDIDLIIYDNQDMSANIIFFGDLSSNVVRLILKDLIIPKPAGVRYNYITTGTAIFSYNLDDEEHKGYNEGYWGGRFKIFSLDSEDEADGLFAGLDIGSWLIFN